jgi:hypothetical protein
MRIRHTITFLDYDLPHRQAAALRSQLQLLQVVRADAALLNFVVYEDDVCWTTIANLLRDYRAIDLAWTEFSPTELAGAAWLDVRATSHHGYPMPSDDFSFLSVTFGEGNYCAVCGTRKAQAAPFRFRAEPRWGRRGLLQLNWLFDEFFAEPGVYSASFSPLGVKAREVLHYRTDKALQSVVQLVPDSDSAELELGDSEAGACEACGIKRYLPLGRLQPRVRAAALEGKHLVRSTQRFSGGGQSSNRIVMISGTLYSQLRKHDVRGVSYGVVPIVDAA